MDPRERLDLTDSPALMATVEIAVRSAYPETRVCPVKVTTSLVPRAPRDRPVSADVPVTMVGTDFVASPVTRDCVAMTAPSVMLDPVDRVVRRETPVIPEATVIAVAAALPDHVA